MERCRLDLVGGRRRERAGDAERLRLAAGDGRLQQERRVLGEVVRLAPKLVVDPFGNYVVQYILDLRQPPLTHAIVQALRKGKTQFKGKMRRCDMPVRRAASDSLVYFERSAVVA